MVECVCAALISLGADLVEYSLVLFERADNHDDSALVCETLEARSHESNNVFSRDVAGEM